MPSYRFPSSPTGAFLKKVKRFRVVRTEHWQSGDICDMVFGSGTDHSGRVASELETLTVTLRHLRIAYYSTVMHWKQDFAKLFFSGTTSKVLKLKISVSELGKHQLHSPPDTIGVPGLLLRSFRSFCSQRDFSRSSTSILWFKTSRLIKRSTKEPGWFGDTMDTYGLWAYGKLTHPIKLKRLGLLGWEASVPGQGLQTKTPCRNMPKPSPTSGPAKLDFPIQNGQFSRSHLGHGKSIKQPWIPQFWQLHPNSWQVL